MSKFIYRMRAEERLASAGAYLGVILPLWGLLIAWAIREAWRERSRHVVFHTTQAIWTQAGLLAATVVYALDHMALKVLIFAARPIGGAHGWAVWLSRVNDAVIVILALAYVAVCLVVAWLVLDNRPVVLPLIGPRIRRQVFDAER